MNASIARRRTAGLMAAALVCGLAFAPGAAAAPEYWVDNEWIRVSGETNENGTLAIHAECKQQGFPEYIVSHVDDAGTVTATEKSGKYCPRGGAEITFRLPLPASGTYRIEFHRIEGAM